MEAPVVEPVVTREIPHAVPTPVVEVLVVRLVKHVSAEAVVHLLETAAPPVVQAVKLVPTVSVVQVAKLPVMEPVRICKPMTATADNAEKLVPQAKPAAVVLVAN